MSRAPTAQRVTRREVLEEANPQRSIQSFQKGTRLRDEMGLLKAVHEGERSQDPLGSSCFIPV